METPLFEHVRPLKAQAVRRLLGALLSGCGSIALGVWVLPRGIGIFEWDGVGEMAAVLFGHFLLAAGAIAVAGESFRYLLNKNREGYWEIRLTADRLTWSAPKHLYGRETSFDVPTVEIERIEQRTFSGIDGPDRVEYWLYTKSRRPIQLKPYAGLNLNSFSMAAKSAGIDYQQTRD